MKEINKKRLIQLVNELGDQIDKREAIKDEDNKDRNNGVGTNQFRELAALSKRSDTFDELYLLVQYKIAKAGEDREWNSRSNGGKSIGAIILEQMKKVEAEYGEDVMEALSLFFGYLYQSARVWRAENPLPKRENSNRNNNSNNRSNNRNNNGRRW